MRRFRTQWLALFGALVILSLSLSSVFGARPTVDANDTSNLGQQVRTFVHSILFAEQEGEGEEDEDTDETNEESDEEESEEAKNHGQCVSEVARSLAMGENGTHGWAVSLAARITCWLPEEENGTEEPEEDSADDSAEDGEDESEATSERQRGKSAAAHQRKADRVGGKPDWAGAKAGDARGNGRANGHARSGRS